ncbi:MAG: 4-(cytidine 5'-diphospho)-2-C-methyl-D-erythritol kinase [Candidatus Cloacimonadota bacterium]|nr:4-(cytidine 5'-diphospho)-2-C-methyl-D-erythritol kinase [Candidatus Cloacimonadota bacterium]
MAKEITKKSNAKINLFLDILKKKPDGFHEIRTIFTEVDVWDSINFVLTKKPYIKIFVNVKSLANRRNLAYKIAFFIHEKYRVKKGVEINLEKKIPISAGLGGGSSNAAQTILALSELWDLNLSKSEMHKIASKFGSDINYFLEGGTAIGIDRGNIIKKTSNQLKIDNILLINPRIEISSGEAYSLVKISQPNNGWEKLLDNNIKFAFNKLEDGVFKKYPMIKNIKEVLLKHNALNAIMSGSGPTVIGFFDNKDELEEAQNFFSKKGFWTIKTKTT